jgi:HEPN domain-containing protein
MEPETENWLKIAEEDMTVAQAAWDIGLYSPCIYHCQQAIEKAMKAALVENGLTFPKTHDLLRLADILGLDLDRDQRETDQYNPTRYGDVRIEYPPDVAENYFETTKRMYSWLRQQLS